MPSNTSAQTSTALSDGATLIQSSNQSTDLILYPVDSVFIQSDKNSEKKGGVGMY